MAEVVYPPVVRVAKGFFRALDLKISVEGADNIPRTGGAVMAINHIGYLDFVFAGLTAQPSKRLVRFMAKEEVFRHRVAGPLMRGMHHIPVDRVAGAASYTAAVDALRAGEIVGVFPEATISQAFVLKEFKSGAARMAIEAQVPILPVVVWGSQRIITKGRKPDWRRHTPVSLCVAEPLRPGPDEDALDVTEQLRERMDETLVRLQKEYPDSPAGPDDMWWVPAHLGGTAPTREEAAEMARLEVEQRAARRAAGEKG